MLEDLRALLALLRDHGVTDYEGPLGDDRIALHIGAPRAVSAPADEARREGRRSRALELLPGAREVGGDDPEVAS